MADSSIRPEQKPTSGGVTRVAPGHDGSSVVTFVDEGGVEHTVRLAVNLFQRVLGIVGPVAMRELAEAEECYRDDLVTWALELPYHNDDHVSRVARGAIYASALSSRFPGNWNHEHFRCSAVYHVCDVRDRARGVATGCDHHGLYQRAESRMGRDIGRRSEPLRACICPPRKT
jgi:hypothetical protein